MGEIANLTRVEKMIKETKKWNNLTKKRYHKFIQYYIDNDYDIKLVAEKFHYSINDISSIFSRIEKELEKHQWDNEELFKELTPIQKEKLIQTLKTIEKLQVTKESFPEKLSKMVFGLIEHKNLNIVCKQLNVKKQYIVQRILGRNSPRKPCEKGALYYLGISSEKKVS